MISLSDYRAQWFGNIRGDLLSGLVVALALIPEAIAFSIIAGVDPKVGLYASFSIAVLIAFVGGRPGMISAATAATAVLMVTLVRDHGLQYLLAATVLAGVLQVAAGLLRLGRFMRFVSKSVMTGFVNALAILIFMAQLPELNPATPGVTWLTYTLVAAGLAIIYLFPLLTRAIPSPLVTIVDDGTMGNEWGTFAIDDEGTPAQRNVLIEDGVLTDYMWDQLRARKEGRRLSGNGRRQSYKHLPMVRMTNTILTNGETNPDDIVADTPNGVYVAHLGGGQVNTATGDFVFGMTEAYLIEDGKITEPLREGNLIGNGPKVLEKIDALGNDFEMGPPGTCGKDGQGVPVGDGVPTLRVSSLTVGGTAA